MSDKLVNKDRVTITGGDPVKDFRSLLRKVLALTLLSQRVHTLSNIRTPHYGPKEAKIGLYCG